MKVSFFLLALVAFGGLAANTGYAQYHPATAKPVAKPAPTSPGPRHGSIGGPAKKAGGISGLATKDGGINGTVHPKY